MTTHDILLLLALIIFVPFIVLMTLYFRIEWRRINAKYAARKRAIEGKYLPRIAALHEYRAALDRRQWGVGSADEVVAAYHAALRAYSERETDGQEAEGGTE